MTFFERLDKFDQRWGDKLNVAEKPGPMRSLASFFAHSGDSWFMLPVFGIVWLVGDAEWKFRAVVFSIAIVVTACLVFGIKAIFKRPRPEGDWGEVYRRTDPHSFPSGHATRAGLVMLLAVFLGPPWLAIVGIIWGPLVALARVAMNVHYVSDIMVGFVFGLVLATGIGLLVL